MKTITWDKFKSENNMRQTATEHRVIAERYTGAPCFLYTLDGVKDALVCGRLHKFATIRAMDSTISIEVTWPLVERKMEGDKTFYTC